MPSIFDDETATFTVVVNAEEQYSIWPLGWVVPAGWQEAGFSGNKADCLGHIEKVWTDMRPASLRKAMMSSDH